ncbi:MAG: DNA polymerase I, thermostable [Syntrophomonadaceae bacterium]|nr:DNA polymerase I, thermostable [Bacillota bacterium]MBT9147870.1 DNA polymerase I, thermostable [Bacillota bacterium]
MKKRLFLIDGNLYVYRAYYAMKDLTTSRGELSGAIYGFSRMLINLLYERKPDYLAIVFDLPAPTFRHRQFSAYKANRPKMPHSLQNQLIFIKEIVRAFNVQIFELEGYEADDILATVAKKTEKEIDVFIFTKDKDILQLISHNIKVVDQKKIDHIYDLNWVREKYSLEPARITDVMALCGDSTDNIPGVAGVGEKTSLKLIQEFGSLENLFNNLERVKNEKLQESLINSVEQVRINHELLTLSTEVPLEMKIDHLRITRAYWEKVVEIFARFEFDGLLRKIDYYYKK